MGVDISDAKIYVTIQDDTKKSPITLISGEDFTVSYDSENKNTVGELHLTQEQTLGLSGTCTVQARYVFADGESGATKKQKIVVQDVIMKDVISYV